LNCNQYFGNLKHNSFRVLFDKIAFVFLFEKYINLSMGNGQPMELCQLYRHTFVPYYVTVTVCYLLTCGERYC